MRKTKIREKKFYDTKVFLEFLVAEGERRKIEEIPPESVEEPGKIKRFVLSVRTKNGEVF
jgi:hypothetical protein